jgi:hypothetical protein
MSVVASMSRDIFSSSNCWAVVRLRVGAVESMSAKEMPHFELAHPTPYVTVTTDDEGGICWAVVGLGTVVRCYTGHHAITVLQAMCTATGVVTPS